MPLRSQVLSSYFYFNSTAILCTFLPVQDAASPPEDHVVAIWQRAVRAIVVYGYKTLHRLPVPVDFAGLAEWPESEVVHELEHLLWRVPTRPLQCGIQLEDDRS